MTSPSLDSTHDRQCRAWHDITTLGLHTRSNNVGRRMHSLPMGHTDSLTASGIACHHRPWTTNTVERRRVWHDIIAFEQHTQLNDVGRGMLSSPLGSTHGRMTLGVACHHRLWAAQMVERRRAWHEITALGLHRRSDNVGCGMTSSPLDCTHSRTTSGMA